MKKDIYVPQVLHNAVSLILLCEFVLVCPLTTRSVVVIAAAVVFTSILQLVIMLAFGWGWLLLVLSVLQVCIQIIFLARGFDFSVYFYAFASVFCQPQLPVHLLNSRKFSAQRIDLKLICFISLLVIIVLIFLTNSYTKQKLLNVRWLFAVLIGANIVCLPFITDNYKKNVLLDQIELQTELRRVDNGIQYGQEIERVVAPPAKEGPNVVLAFQLQSRAQLFTAKRLLLLLASPANNIVNQTKALLQLSIQSYIFLASCFLMQHFKPLIALAVFLLALCVISIFVYQLRSQVTYKQLSAYGVVVQIAGLVLIYARFMSAFAENLGLVLALVGLVFSFAASEILVLRRRLGREHFLGAIVGFTRSLEAVLIIVAMLLIVLLHSSSDFVSFVVGVGLSPMAVVANQMQENSGDARQRRISE